MSLPHFILFLSLKHEDGILLFSPLVLLVEVVSVIEDIFVLPLFDKLVYFRIFQPIFIDEQLLPLLLSVDPVLEYHAIGHIVLLKFAQNAIYILSIIFLLLLPLILMPFQTVCAFPDATAKILHHE